MREFPRGGFIGRTVRLFREMVSLRIPLHAANAGYFIVLSVFPALVLLLGLLRYTGLRLEYLVALIGSLIPEALIPVAEELITAAYENTTGAVVSLSAVSALWSASRGVYGLLLGLNSIYGVGESRGYFYTRFISMAYTFAFLLVLLLTLVLHVFGNAMLTLLSSRGGSFAAFLTEALNLRFFLLLGAQSLVFTLMFTVLPNCPCRFRDNIPGGVFASLGWLVFTDIYSVYAERFTSLRNVYGSVYAVALSMLWLYCCLSIVFYGGALNRYLLKNKDTRRD